MNLVLKAKKEKGMIQTKLEVKKRSKSYLDQLREEIKKISWPQMDELKICTKVVIGATFFFGFGIYFSDLVIKSALDTLSILCKAVFG